LTIIPALRHPVVLPLLAGLLLSACAVAHKTTPVAPVAAPASRPAIGGFGFDLSGMDPGVRPGDDFYRYANGAWAARTPIPVDRARYGAFDALREKAERDVRAIIESVAAQDSDAGSNARKVGDFYRSFMDEAAINAQGLAPLKADLGEIDSLTSRTDLVRHFGRAMLDDIRLPFGLFIDQDLKQPDRYVVYLTQSGLGMPDRDYYLAASFAETRKAYVAHIAAMLALAGLDQVETRAAGILDLESRIARVHWSKVENRDDEKTYNALTSGELQARAPGVDWPALLEAAGIDGQERYIVRQPSAFAGMAKLVATVPLAVWQDYLRFHLLSRAADVLPTPFVTEDFAFYGKTLSGTPVLRDRWKRGVAATEGALGEAVGALYVARHYPPEAKARMDVLIANLLDAYRQRIGQLDWMSPQTRTRALDKLDRFTPKIGYPVKWIDYGALVIEPGDAYGNDKRATLFESRRQIAKLGKPVDRTEWFMTPQTVNAYYNPAANEIVFPAAILQPPFFDPHADDAVNYGAIGAVIGHEIGHGFDDQGSKFTGDGRLESWWTADDRKRFEERTQQLVAAYDRFAPLPGTQINGALTLGENIGDLGGLEAAYTAWRLSLKGGEAPVIDGLTGDQRFFLGFAQIWRTLIRDEALKRQITTDPHSPGLYRVQGVVPNLDAWYRAFDVKPGDAMYIPPEKRVRIW